MRIAIILISTLILKLVKTGPTSQITDGKINKLQPIKLTLFQLFQFYNIKRFKRWK